MRCEFRCVLGCEIVRGLIGGEKSCMFWMPKSVEFRMLFWSWKLWCRIGCENRACFVAIWCGNLLRIPRAFWASEIVGVRSGVKRCLFWEWNQSCWDSDEGSPWNCWSRMEVKLCLLFGTEIMLEFAMSLWAWNCRCVLRGKGWKDVCLLVRLFRIVEVLFWDRGLLLRWKSNTRKKLS